MSAAVATPNTSRDALMAEPTMQTEIALLNQEVASLHRIVGDVNTKVDLLVSMQLNLQRLQDRTDHHEAAFRKSEEDQRRATEKLRNDLDNCFKVANGARDSLSSWVNRGFGGLVVGGLLLGCLQWFVLRELATYRDGAEVTQANSAHIEKIECALLKECGK
jgi:hypothetical protein